MSGLCRRRAEWWGEWAAATRAMQLVRKDRASGIALDAARSCVRCVPCVSCMLRVAMRGFPVPQVRMQRANL